MSETRLKKIERLADLLDSRIRIFGWRIGWDGILGLIPFFGGLLTGLLSLYIICQAAFMGAPAPVLTRMGINVIFDALLEAVPVLGNLADFVWKANNRNLDLLKRHLENPAAIRRSSIALITTLLAALSGLCLLAIWLAFQIASALWHLIVAVIS